MRLKPVTIGGDLAIVTHRNGQKVVLDIGVVDARPGPDEGSTFKMIGGAVAGPEEQPLRPDHRLGKQVQMLVEGNRLGAFHLQVEFQMVHQVFAHAPQVLQGRDAGGFQISFIANA